jgi:hypothetical protein
MSFAQSKQEVYLTRVMPAPKCHFDGEVTAETGSGLFVDSSD